MLIMPNDHNPILKGAFCWFAARLARGWPGVVCHLGFCRAKRIAFGAALAKRNAQPQVSNAKTSANAVSNFSAIEAPFVQILPVRPLSDENENNNSRKTYN